jgi:hypothetical protein
VAVEEITLGDVRLRVDRDQLAHGDDYAELGIRVDLRDLVAETSLFMYAVDLEGLAKFFRDLDRSWRGWQGEKRTPSTESWLAF